MMEDKSIESAFIAGTQHGLEAHLLLVEFHNIDLLEQNNREKGVLTLVLIFLLLLELLPSTEKV